MASTDTLSPIFIERSLSSRSLNRLFHGEYDVLESSNMCADGTYRDEPEEMSRDKYRDMTQTFTKFDDIIGQIETLRIAEVKEKNSRKDESKETQKIKYTMNVIQEMLCIEKKSNDQSSEEDELDLIERGPIRPNVHQLPRSQPYAPIVDWLAGSSAENDSTDYDSTAERIMMDDEYSKMLNPCLDELSDSLRHSQVSYSPESLPKSNDQGTDSNWTSPRSAESQIFSNSSPMRDTMCLPSIVVNGNAEDSIIELLSYGEFQPATVTSDTGSNSVSSPLTKADTWTDSPVSSYNPVLSRPNSRSSSRAQSPGSGLNLGSPMMHPNVIGSPIGSPQVSGYRVPQGLSSSSSSNQSFGDTPSPGNYQTPLNQRVEEQFSEDFDGLSKWRVGYNSSSTIVNSAETVSTLDSELELVEEVLNNLNDRYPEEVQVVPKSQSNISRLNEPSSSYSPIAEQTASSETTCQNKTYACSYDPDFPRKVQVSEDQKSNEHQDYAILNGLFEDSNVNRLSSCRDWSDFTNYHITDYNIASTSQDDFSDHQGTRSTQQSSPASSSSTPDFNDFQIPSVVTSFRSNRSRRNSERAIMPLPSLNLPAVGASERLKEGLNPRDVERAMMNLLKKSPAELAKPDIDGDSALMCLVSNPDEVSQKKAYLAPLVERLGNVTGALSATNNRGEDALYLAAMNCPQMAYVAGYLAAAMLQKGIDINQKLYHTRGDSLIHSVAAKGDTHGEVLAELLSLKTSQGIPVFDLSKRNYDGRTALHVAVESHDPSRGIQSIGTVRLLLDNGADSKIKETKCGDTALHMALALSCDPNLLKVLLSKCSSEVINAVNYSGNTPLHIACAASKSVSLERQKEACLQLVNAGGHTNQQNRQGKTPLALVSTERKEIIKRAFYKKC